MQSVLVYGRLFSRAVANGIYSVSTGGQGAAAPHTSPPAASASSSPAQGVEADPIGTASSHRKKLRFLTAVSGFPKNRTLEKVKPGKFGDDAYFVVKHAQGDVIGECACCCCCCCCCGLMLPLLSYQKLSLRIMPSYSTRLISNEIALLHTIYFCYHEVSIIFCVPKRQECSRFVRNYCTLMWCHYCCFMHYFILLICLPIHKLRNVVRE